MKDQILKNLVGYIQDEQFHIQGSENTVNEHFWLNNNGFESRKEFQDWFESEGIQLSEIGCGKSSCGKCLDIVNYLLQS